MYLVSPLICLSLLNVVVVVAFLALRWFFIFFYFCSIINYYLLVLIQSGVYFQDTLLSYVGHILDIEKWIADMWRLIWLGQQRPNFNGSFRFDLFVFFLYIRWNQFIFLCLFVCCKKNHCFALIKVLASSTCTLYKRVLYYIVHSCKLLHFYLHFM